VLKLILGLKLAFAMAGIRMGLFTPSSQFWFKKKTVEADFFFDKSKYYIKKAQRGATLSTLRVYKRD
jgi:hypothetical protein